MKFIGLTGRKRSGKDLSSLILKDYLDYKTIAFADAVKDAMIGIDLRGVVVKHQELYIPDGKPDHRDLDLKIDIHSIYAYIRKVLNKLELDENTVYFSAETVYNVLQKYDFYSFRRLMQIISTDLVHPYDKKFWVNKTFNKALQLVTKGVIITDIRFMHEYDTVKHYKGLVIRVNRNQETTDLHESENQDIPYDVLVDNNLTKQDLEYKLINLKEIQCHKKQSN